MSIAIDIVKDEPEDISYLNAKAVIIEGQAEIKNDTNGSLARQMYERYVGKDALNHPMVQSSTGMPRYMLIVRPLKIMSCDLSKINKMSG